LFKLSLIFLLEAIFNIRTEPSVLLERSWIYKKKRKTQDIMRCHTGASITLDLNSKSLH